MRKTKSKWSKVTSAAAENRAAWLMIAPAIILLLWWYLYPIVQSLVLSFQEVNKFHFSDRTFVGLTNYQELFADPAFFKSLGITAVFVLLVVPAQTVGALLVAALLKSVKNAKSVFRTSIFVPYMTSTVAVTTIFMQMFVKDGPLSSFFSMFGTPNVTWYADTSMALLFLVIVYVYMFVGLYIVILAGGMESIDDSLYEAAEMDGAGSIRQFFTVTLPGVRPFLFFVIVAGFIQAVQVFDQAYIITGGTTLGSPAGATSTLVIFLYQQAFRLNNVGVGAAATVIFFAIIVIAGILQRTRTGGEK